MIWALLSTVPSSATPTRTDGAFSTWYFSFS